MGEGLGHHHPARLPLQAVIADGTGGGQGFIHAMVDKVAELRAMIGDRPVHIEIDGGITPDTAPAVVAAGADVLVAGSSVFKGGSVADPAPYGRNMKAIRAAVA